MDQRKYEPIFGSWYITDEIGSGAEGRLYRIYRTDSLGHRYYSALKAISVPGSESEIVSMMAGGMEADELKEYYESVLDNTTHEFEILEKLKGNSNIVSYEDHEIYRHDDGMGWDILIRLEELTPLVKYSIDKPLSEDEVARMGRDICSGLSLCSKFGIVHRDIKPDNIFISPGGSYKLGDFGIARIIEKTTAGLSRKGTYEYMAPEIYWGREYGASVDLYSLGMVMYRYLNDGRMPFMPVSPEPFHAGDREEAFIKRMNGHDVPPPHNGSDGLKRIVMKACAYDRSERYAKAEDMFRDLEMLQNGKSYDGYDHNDPAKNSDNSAKKPNSPVKGAGASDSKGDHENQKKKSRRGRVIAALIALIMAAAIAVYAYIPKEVTDIDAGAAEGAAEIYIGDELTPEYTVLPDRFSDEPISFTSSDEGVASVDANGVIHAVNMGEATMTMHAKEYSEDSVIKVVPKVTEISGIDKEISLTTGGSLTLKPVLSPEKFADEPVSFSTKDKAIAKVTTKGKLKAISAGETVLTVSSGGCTFESKVTISDPVVYVPQTSYSQTGSSSKKKSSSSSKKSSSSSKKKSSGASKGYFSSSDDEHF